VLASLREFARTDKFREVCQMPDIDLEIEPENGNSSVQRFLQSFASMPANLPPFRLSSAHRESPLAKEWVMYLFEDEDVFCSPCPSTST
jgi:hypothetical protein